MCLKMKNSDNTVAVGGRQVTISLFPKIYRANSRRRRNEYDIQAN
jgi:hypothetical protein